MQPPQLTALTLTYFLPFLELKVGAGLAPFFPCCFLQFQFFWKPAFLLNVTVELLLVEETEGQFRVASILVFPFLALV